MATRESIIGTNSNNVIADGNLAKALIGDKNSKKDATNFSNTLVSTIQNILQLDETDKHVQQASDSEDLKDGLTDLSKHLPDLIWQAKINEIYYKALQGDGDKTKATEAVQQAWREEFNQCLKDTMKEVQQSTSKEFQELSEQYKTRMTSVISKLITVGAENSRFINCSFTSKVNNCV